jgi:hypothetical protein
LNARKNLSDILANGGGDDFRNRWNQTAAAGDFGPLPPGEYICRVLSGELFTSKHKNTPGYKLTLQVAEGDFAGRRCWPEWWLTPAALPMLKRDLGKIGITTPEQLERPLPPAILVRIKLALHRDDDGNESNKLKSFEFHGVEEDPFGVNGDGTHNPPPATPEGEQP